MRMERMQPAMDAAYSRLALSPLQTNEGRSDDAGQLERESQPAESPELISRTARLIDLTAIILPFLVFIAAVILTWGRGFGWTDLGIMIGMYLLTGLGVTVGFHRLFAHKAFQAPRAVTLIIAVLGSMSVQGPLLWWVALHRRHHHHSD